MPAGTPITLRLTVQDPIPGITYSLCDKKNAPVGAQRAAGDSVSFNVPVRVADDGRMLGEFVRSEGPFRRFVYIAIDWQVMPPTGCTGRMKIDVHDIPADLVQAAKGGAVIETVLNGRGRNGRPAYATQKAPWRLA